MKYIVVATVEIIQIDRWEIEADSEDEALENYEDGDLLDSDPHSWMVSELKVHQPEED